MGFKGTLVVASAVVLLGAGCSSAAPAPTGAVDTGAAAAHEAAAVDPCALVTQAEASTLLEEPAAAGLRTTKDSLPWSDTCLYSLAQHDPTQLAGALRMVQVEVTSDHAGFSAADFYKSGKEGFASVGTVQDVPGLGDDAYYDGTGVRILYHGRILYVSVGTVEDKKYDKTLEVAKLALPRMP